MLTIIYGLASNSKAARQLRISSPASNVIARRIWITQGRGSLGSTMGRFLSPDPHNAGAIPTSPQTWNAYVYVSNNPLTLTDPTGMMAQDADSNSGYGPARLPYDRAAGIQNLVVFLEDVSLAASLQAAQTKPAPTATNQSQQQFDPKTGPTDPTNPSKPLFKNKQFKKESDKLFEKTYNGKAREGLAEAGVAVEYKNGEMSFGKEVDSVNDSGTANELRVPVDADTIAIIHTHGNSALPTPGPGDLDARSRIPNFVRSQSALYVTVPNTKTFIQLEPPPH